jgi:hypothetical protein
LGKNMTREGYRGKKLVSHFTPVGHVYWTNQKTESALKWNIPADTGRLVSALMLAQMNRIDMAEGGMEIDVAPTGSEMIPTLDEKEEIVGYEFPFIDVASASMMTKFDNILINSLIKDPKKKWRLYIGDLIKTADLLKTMTPEEVVRYVFEDMRLAVEDITQKPVIYRGIGSLATHAAGLSQST